ncbi:ABA4-like family protein [Streptomyces sp. NBC_00654]|uniref:ABA4-like family protein n=1 Tax=Streptomyces sp. NBC_00654 TaxID=2975799 RepID=UPI00225B1EE5|nr:ABA4-like family protein [Streptomyces sp. NBC_00654]MCX4968330.1 ABA4-like family protein [Streptomyces sp. NBC_00654]
MTGALFEITFYLTAPFWLLMIFAPRWATTTRIVSSPLTVLPVLAVYLVLALPVFPELWTAVSNPDIDAFRDLAALGNGAGALWAQVIAWDLLLGQWMFLQARKLAVSPLVMGPLLVLTILLSPFGLLIFLAIRAVRQAKGAEATDAPSDDGIPGRAGETAVR